MKQTTSPNPNWKPGDSIESPVSGWVEIDPDQKQAIDLYKLLIGAVVPRPIAFVSTCDEKGVSNLAPFSFFMGVSSNPPCLAVSIAQGATDFKKDTIENIQATGEFVVNSANEWLVEPLVHCAGAFESGVSEFDESGLSPIASVRVKPPRVKEAAVQFECQVEQIVPIGDGSPGSTHLVVGRIVLAHVAEHAYDNGRILLEEIKPVARLGGLNYGLLGDIFSIPVPQVKRD